MDATLEECVAGEELEDGFAPEEVLCVDEALADLSEALTGDDFADEEELEEGLIADEDAVEACDELVPWEELVGFGGTTTEAEDTLAVEMCEDEDAGGFDEAAEDEKEAGELFPGELELDA